MPQDDRRFIGPIERGPWPDRIPAHIVSSGAWPRILGYDVYRDLAAHYRWGEVVFATLGSDVPSTECGRAFDVAMVFLSPTSIAHAPAHASRVAHMVGARSPSAVAVAAICAAEEAHQLVEESLPFLGWLAGEPTAPRPALARKPAPPEVIDALRAALPESLRPALPSGIDLDVVTACLRVLVSCGIEDPDLLEQAVMMARLPAALAEGRQVGRRFRDYPMDRPRFVYVEDDR